MLLENAMKIQEYTAKIDKTFNKVTVILGIAIMVNVFLVFYALGIYLAFFI